MIQPEPTRVRYHAGIDCAAGRHSWCSVEVAPAAGHLGVVEEQCHNQMHEMYLVESMPCLSCGAAV